MQTPYDVKKSVDTPTKDQKNHARKFEHNAFECHPKKHRGENKDQKFSFCSTQ